MHFAPCSDFGEMPVFNPKEVMRRADTFKQELEDMKAAVDFVHYSES
jgi:hypothetical protein